MSEHLKLVEQAELTMDDARRMGEALQARLIAKAWLEARETLKPEHATPYRCFVLGYLAATKDRT